MSSEERVKAEPCASAFSGCLVDGDAATTARERRIKRRAIVISVVLQTMGLAALVIAPLFAKPAELNERIFVPVPAYRHSAAPRHPSEAPPNRQQPQRCAFCAPTRIPPTIVTIDRSGPPEQPTGPVVPIGAGGPEEQNGLVNIFDVRRTPDVPDNTTAKKRLVIAHLDPALLVRRIEPVYPALARQIRRNGKVELHALIAIDGTVQSLEVVSGDPLFVSSALEAVKQWRYKPTYLNGNPMEVDTYITVIYTLQQ
jgi:protein TonB